MDFWTRLKGEIKAKNTTQEWIARKAGIPFGTFRKWLTRRTYPNVQIGHAIAELLETSVGYLLTGAKAEAETAVEAEGLNDTERRLIKAYRKLSSADRENVILAVDAWARKSEHRLFRKQTELDARQMGEKSTAPP